MALEKVLLNGSNIIFHITNIDGYKGFYLTSIILDSN